MLSFEFKFVMYCKNGSVFHDVTYSYSDLKKCIVMFDILKSLCDSNTGIIANYTCSVYFGSLVILHYDTKMLSDELTLPTFG